MTNKWKVKSSEAGERLDVFLAYKMDGIMTRSAIAKKLKAGAGTVNDKVATVHAFLKVGDVVKLDSRDVVQEKHAQVAAERYVEPTIVAETPDWVVIDKPVGLLVHPTIKEEKNTLVDWFVEKYPKSSKVGEDPARPGIVHRLDREVSGLMVMAKTQDAHDSLKEQFAGRKTKKTYIALVHGHPPMDEGEIKFRIGRSKTQPRMAAKPVASNEGKAAWTHYRTLKTFKNASLLELEIYSGRTHQIRAHLFALECPIVGDELYTYKGNARIQTDRMMLQSIGLSFLDPKTGQEQTFNLPPSPSFLSYKD